MKNAAIKFLSGHNLLLIYISIVVSILLYLEAK